VGAREHFAAEQRIGGHAAKKLLKLLTAVGQRHLQCAALAQVLAQQLLLQGGSGAGSF
jgi:hypothetical protein